MLFTFPCSCGKHILVDESAGRQFFCPECGRIHDMPRRAVAAAPATPAQIAILPVEALPRSASNSAPSTFPFPIEPLDEPEVLIAPIAAPSPAPPVSAPPRQDVPAAPAELPFATPLPAPPNNATAPTVRTAPALPMAVPLTEETPSAAEIADFPSVAPMSRVAASGDVALDDIRLQKRVDTTRAWSRLTLGLGFFYGQFLSNLITLTILMAGINITSMVEDHAKPRVWLFLLLVTTFGIFLLGPALGITGSILCFFVPQKVCRRILPAWALGLNTAPVLFGVVFAVLLAIVGGMILSLVAMMLGLMAMYAAWIFYMFFLKQIAEYMEMHSCVDDANDRILQSIPLMIAPWGILIMAGLLADTTVGPYLVFLMLTIWLVFNSKFMLAVLDLVSTMRQAIRTRERV